MDASIQRVEKILDGGNKYLIPPYQRPYRWDPEDAEKLVQDIHESYQSDEDEYFIGSMICIEQDGGYEVVDGQQRLITLTLILRVLMELIEKEKIKNALQGMILPTNIFSDEESPSIRVREQESEFYLQILSGKQADPKTNTQKVFNTNKERIFSYLKSMTQDGLEKLTEHLLRKVLIVFVVTNDDTSSFRLFNVLNDRGVRLTDADLLKNFLFGEVANDKGRAKKAEKKWQQIEDSVGEKEIGRFLLLHIHSEKKNRDRVIKIGGKRVSNFAYCKDMLKREFSGDAIQMLDYLIKSANNYSDILNGGLSVGKSTSFMQELSAAKLTEWLPSVLAFLNKHGGGDEFQEFVSLMEKIYTQCCLMKLTSGQRDKACYVALDAINNDASFSKIMERVRDCADNKKFEESLDAPGFYDGSRRQIVNLIKTVLKRVDAEREDDSVNRTYSGRITVEHILPQNRSERYWQERFTEEQHAGWKNRLGNLTLISGSKNSAAKNFAFGKKKETYKNLNKKCSFEITKELCDLPHWDMETLKDRHERIKKEIKELWLVS